MANFFSSLFGGTDPSIMTQNVTDPLKQAVANPLSNYLSSQVGQGLPSYGGEMVAGLPQGGGASVAPFLGMSSQDLINQNNSAAENEFKNSFDANVLEGHAGSLSSSGAGQDENSSETALQLGLASQDVGIETSLPSEQLQLAQGLSANQTAQDQAAYQNWYTSLAQNNPALSQAMQFLQNSTGTGTTVLSALNPGQQSILPGLLSAAGSIGAAAITGGASVTASAALGAALNSSNNDEDDEF